PAPPGSAAALRHLLAIGRPTLGIGTWTGPATVGPRLRVGDVHDPAPEPEARRSSRRTGVGPVRKRLRAGRPRLDYQGSHDPGPSGRTPVRHGREGGSALRRVHR